MENNVTLTEDDERKAVVDIGGTEVGRVIEVNRGTAYVEPDPEVTDVIRSKLGWSDTDEGSYQLDANSVERIYGNEIHLDK